MISCELADFVALWLSERPYLPWHVKVDSLPIDGIFLDKTRDEFGSANNYFMFCDNVSLTMEVSLCDNETGPYSEPVAELDVHDPEFFEKLEALLIYATPQYPRITPDWSVSEGLRYDWRWPHDFEKARENYLARY